MAHMLVVEVNDAQFSEAMKRLDELIKNMTPALRGIGAVSYTHLDVYKRQRQYSPRSFYSPFAGFGSVAIVVDQSFFPRR